MHIICKMASCAMDSSCTVLWIAWFLVVESYEDAVWSWTWTLGYRSLWCLNRLWDNYHWWTKFWLQQTFVFSRLLWGFEGQVYDCCCRLKEKDWVIKKAFSIFCLCIFSKESFWQALRSVTNFQLGVQCMWKLCSLILSINGKNFGVTFQ